MKKIELEIKEREKREMVEIEEEINGTRSYGVFFCKWCERERERGEEDEEGKFVVWDVKMNQN